MDYLYIVESRIIKKVIFLDIENVIELNPKIQRVHRKSEL